jgi:hypothetical protein
MTTPFEIPHFEMPRLRTLARHAIPHVVEGTVVPLVLFLLTRHFVGVWGAVLIGMIWTYVAVGRRLVTGQRVRDPAPRRRHHHRTHRHRDRFGQRRRLLPPAHPRHRARCGRVPPVGGVAPAAGRTAGATLPHPHRRARLRPWRFFLQISLLWAFTQLASTAVTLLLFSQSLATFLVAKTLVVGTDGGASQCRLSGSAGRCAPRVLAHGPPPPASTAP